MTARLARLGSGLGRLLQGPDRLAVEVGPAGPAGGFSVPSSGDGTWETTVVQGRACLRPAESAYYLYCVLPEAFRRRATQGLWVEVEYHGSRYGEFRLQYASGDAAEPWDGLYKTAEQRWPQDATALARFRRALFPLPDFDPCRTQNQGASFRLEFRRELLVSRIAVSLAPPPDLEVFTGVAPLPELRKMPGRHYPINYLFVEITNACNFKCTWCPDEIMGRRRGFMKKERVFRLLDEVAEKRAWLGPLYPVKLHQMGEPMMHPDLAQIVAHAEQRGVPIELNTNCGHITRERVDALFEAGLTNLILSYQTPDPETFRTRKAPKLVFDEYRDKVRLAVERKVALGARTAIEIDIMNTKHADGYRIVSEDDQALAFVSDWITFCRDLERRHGLVPRAHDVEAIREKHFLDQDENGGRYALLDGVHLVWKRCHTWGNVIGGHKAWEVVDTYCPAPYDQFVVQWNGDVVSCCTDYEGHTKTANVFASSIEDVWRSRTRRDRLKDMLEGRLLDVCARCQGLK
ncbi:MAG TPA: radical SAM protein [Vicinamibacteria bacterium]|nr:radical SAM protein [Vicinamibacteria bacterium]